MKNEEVVSVEIFDQKYRLSYNENQDGAYIEQAASYLDAKMRVAAKNAGKHKSTADIAILAALEIAKEVLEARQRKENLETKAGAKVKSITEQINQEKSGTDSESSISEPRF